MPTMEGGQLNHPMDQESMALEECCVSTIVPAALTSRCVRAAVFFRVRRPLRRGSDNGCERVDGTHDTERRAQHLGPNGQRFIRLLEVRKGCKIGDPGNDIFRQQRPHRKGQAIRRTAQFRAIDQGSDCAVQIAPRLGGEPWHIVGLTREQGDRELVGFGILNERRM